MSSTKILGKKRNNPIFPKIEENEDVEQSSEISLINCNTDEINALKLEDLENSWNQKSNLPKKLPLKDEKYRTTKYFSKNRQIYPTIKKMEFQIRNASYLFIQEKDYISHCLSMRNYSIEEIIEMNKVKNISFKKYNMILDIDSTLLKSIEIDDNTFTKKETDIYINGEIDNNVPFEYYCRYRPYLFQFIEEIKKYFNFYVSTLGHTNYANKILTDFKKKASIIIPEKNVISNFSNKLVKNIEDVKAISNNSNELNNTIIIDDLINFWIKPLNCIKSEKDIEQCIKCLIPSRRYIIDIPRNHDKDSYNILIHNNILEEQYNNLKTYSIDANYSYCIEKDSDSENGKFGQLYYLTKFIQKCIKFSLFSNISLVVAIDYYRQKIFENCNFNLKFLGNEWNDIIPNIIRELGGKIVLQKDETTHFIIEKKINMDKINKPNKNQIFVNINYIFQCYFNLTRMDENEKQYKN